MGCLNERWSLSKMWNNYCFRGSENRTRDRWFCILYFLPELWLGGRRMNEKVIIRDRTISKTDLELAQQFVRSLKTYTCLRCGHTWTPRLPQPKVCPKCKSKVWFKPKRKRKQWKKSFGKTNLKELILYRLNICNGLIK